MTKNSKNQCMVSVEDSFDSSDCSVFETNFVKWCDAERERLASRGKDITKFCALADPDINEGTILCEDYTLKFNRDECAIDLVVNGALNSPIWDDVIENVPARFAQYLGNPENFVYGFSTTKSKEKWYYSFKRDDKESGTLFPIVGFAENPIQLKH